jgi:hypothetical protein
MRAECDHSRFTPIATHGRVRNGDGQFVPGHMLWCRCGAVRAVFEDGLSAWIPPLGDELDDARAYVS